MTTYSSRDEISEQYRWDLTSIFENDEAFLSALEKAKNYPERCLSFQGRISQSPETLLEYLRFDDEMSIELSKLINYANRKADEDTRSSLYQDYSSQVMSLYVSISGACSWFASELLNIDKETMNQFYQQCPDLELYRRALDVIFRRRDHVLTPAEEKLLASAGDMASQPENVFSLLNDADLSFEDALDSKGEAHPVTHGSYIPLMMSPDRTLRENAYQSLYSTYKQFRNTFAATLGAQNKQLKFYSDARKYPSMLASALDGNEVPTEVYTNLIEAVHHNLPALHNYVKLRKELLGVDELRFSDLYVPIVDDIDLTFTYEQACEIILEALKPMGEEYLTLVRKGLSERWVDVYETPGKRSGAYSSGGFGMHPVILMNFQGKLDDVFTLIHEMGHSIHTYLSCENQPSCYSDYVIFVAEVASTCNEALLTHYFLKHAKNERERAYFLNHFLEQFRATLYRQTMFAEFELKVSELAAQGVGITADALCEIYRKLNEDYFGSDIVVDDNIALEWARIPHFYYCFYVYQYATGFAAAIALSQRILNGGIQERDDYLNFLKGGSSKPPIDLLRGAGVDMMSTLPIENALAQFDTMIDEMANTCHSLKENNNAESSSSAATTPVTVSATSEVSTATDAPTATDVSAASGVPVATDTPAVPDATTNRFTNLNAKQLGESLAKMEGIFVLATTNEDNTPDAAVFVPRMLDEQHLVFFLAQNRSRKNLERTKQAWGVYEVSHPEAKEKQDRYAGARLKLSLVLPEGETAKEFKEATKDFAQMNPAAIVVRIEQLIALG